MEKQNANELQLQNCDHRVLKAFMFTRVYAIVFFVFLCHREKTLIPINEKGQPEAFWWQGGSRDQGVSMAILRRTVSLGSVTKVKKKKGSMFTLQFPPFSPKATVGSPLFTLGLSKMSFGSNIS